MNVGDRITLTDTAVAGANKRTKHVDFDWTGREGVIVKRHSRGVLFGVLWDGRTSIDWWPEKTLVVIEPGPVVEIPARVRPLPLKVRRIRRGRRAVV